MLSPSLKNSSPNNNSDKNNKNVTFDLEEKTQIHEVERCQDMLPDELIEATWYRKSDYAAMNEDNDDAARMMLNGIPHYPDAEICYRGLECRSNTVKARREADTYRALQAVLTEQKRQRIEAMDHDQILVATIYQGYVRSSMEEAQKRGLLDMRECRPKGVYLGDTQCIEFDTVQDDDNISVLSDDALLEKLASTNKSTTAGKAIVRRFKKMIKRPTRS